MRIDEHKHKGKTIPNNTMANRHVSVRYTEFIAENVQQARKVMSDAGLDYDELVATPESEWGGLLEHHRMFMEIRKKIGANNELLGVYAMVMCDIQYDEDDDDDSMRHAAEEIVRDRLYNIYDELTLLKDTLPEFKGGANMRPLLRYETYYKLEEVLKKLKSRHYPERCYEMMCRMPDRVKNVWQKIYCDSSFLKPFDTPEIGVEIQTILETITFRSEDRSNFQSRMALLASSPGRIGPYDFIRAIRELLLTPIDQASYPKFIGVYGPKDEDRYISALSELKKTGYLVDHGYFMPSVGIYDWRINGPQNDQVMLMLPIKMWTKAPVSDMTPEEFVKRFLLGGYDNFKEVVNNKQGNKNLHMKTGTLQLGKGKTLFKVITFVVHHEDLTGFIERMKSRIVGPWKPLLAKEISRYKVRRVMAQKDDED